MSHVNHGEQIIMAEKSRSKELYAAALEHKTKHDAVAQEFMILVSLQGVVTKMTRESLKVPKTEAKLAPEQRRAQLVQRADQDQGVSLGSLLHHVTAEMLVNLLTTHDPALTAGCLLTAACALLIHFHEKFFKFYDQLIALVVTLAEEVKETAVVAGCRLQHDLHEPIYQKFMEAHHGYCSFNSIDAQSGIATSLQSQEEEYVKVEAALTKTKAKLKTDLDLENMTVRGFSAASAPQGNDLDLPGGGNGPLPP